MKSEPQFSEDRHMGVALPRFIAFMDWNRAKKIRRSLWKWLAVVVVVVTVIVMGINWVLVDREPQDPVEDWLQSIADGRSRQGLASLSVGFGATGPPSLPNRAYREALGRIQRWEITSVETHGDTGTVTAKVWWPEGSVPQGHTQGEEHSWAVVKQTKTGPFNDIWALEDHSSAVLSVNTPGLDSITINGVRQRLDPRDRAAADGKGGVWSWEAMPGQFAIGLPQDSDYVLRSQPDPVTVGLEDSSEHRVSLEVEPSPKLWAEVDQAIEKKIVDCMASEVVASEGCPISQRWAEGNVPNAQAPETPMATPTGDAASPTPLPTPTRGASIDSVQWQMVSRPALWLVPDDDTKDPLDWKASEHAFAQARLSYVENGLRVEENISFPVHVNVSSDGSQAQILIALD